MSFVDATLQAFQNAPIEWIAVVPSSGLDLHYQAYSANGRCLFASREEEAVAIASGLAIANARVAVIMQQSGVGNALNAVFTLAEAHDIYFPILVCDRSGYDPNLVQRVSSVKTMPLLKHLGSEPFDWESTDPAAAFAGLVKRRVRWIIGTTIGKE